MADYQKLAQTAQRLIEKNGQSITVVRKSRTAADASKPHRGVEPGETTYSVLAVEKTYDERAVNGTSIRVGDKRYVFAALSLPQGAFLPQRGDFVRVGGGDWGIVDAKPKNPGGTPITYELQVRQG